MTRTQDVPSPRDALLWTVSVVGGVVAALSLFYMVAFTVASFGDPTKPLWPLFGFPFTWLPFNTAETTMFLMGVFLVSLMLVALAQGALGYPLKDPEESAEEDWEPPSPSVVSSSGSGSDTATVETGAARSRDSVADGDSPGDSSRSAERSDRVSEVRLPEVGEGDAQGAELLKWLVAAGDPVFEGQSVAVVAPVPDVQRAETVPYTHLPSDHVEVASRVEGTVDDLRAEPGDVVEVGDLLLTVDAESTPDAHERVLGALATLYRERDEPVSAEDLADCTEMDRETVLDRLDDLKPGRVRYERNPNGGYRPTQAAVGGGQSADEPDPVRGREVVPPDPSAVVPANTSHGGASRDGSTTVTATDEAGPPAEVPAAPDVSVDYSALTDEKLIGSGGAAEVTRATLPTPDGEVTLAVKRPRMAGGETVDQRGFGQLLDEAKTWEKLDEHDHIVGVVDYGTEPVPWIAMEYMDGGGLDDRAGEMTVQQTLWTAVAVTEAVHHAHYRRGVAHLDLKPANVLFRTVEGAWDVPKVADWGLSKHLIDRSQSVEAFSPQYAAPEQFDRQYGAADTGTDIYQLGATFYTLFTGRPPFGTDPRTVVGKVLTDRPTPPSEVADVPPGLDDVVLTAMAREKTDRYDTAAHLRDALEELPEAY